MVYLHPWYSSCYIYAHLYIRICVHTRLYLHLWYSMSHTCSYVQMKLCAIRCISFVILYATYGPYVLMYLCVHYSLSSSLLLPVLYICSCVNLLQCVIDAVSSTDTLCYLCFHMYICICVYTMLYLYPWYSLCYICDRVYISICVYTSVTSSVINYALYHVHSSLTLVPAQRRLFKIQALPFDLLKIHFNFVLTKRSSCKRILFFRSPETKKTYALLFSPNRGHMPADLIVLDSIAVALFIWNINTRVLTGLPPPSTSLIQGGQK
jgi:hypothetical protein